MGKYSNYEPFGNEEMYKLQERVEDMEDKFDRLIDELSDFLTNAPTDFGKEAEIAIKNILELKKPINEKYGIK